MFNSAILEVAIGIIFVYLLLSLLCSAANEIVELWLKKRATDLERGIRELLKSTPGESGDLVHKLYDHPLINGLFKGVYADSGITGFWRSLKGTKLPAYIPSRNFALGLMDLVLSDTPAGVPPGATDPPAVLPEATDATTASIAVGLVTAPPQPAPTIAPVNPLQRFRDALGTSSLMADNPGVQKALTALVDAAGNDVSKTRENIEAWYNSSMDRVSGWYKRRSQVFILILGLFAAVAVNADSVTIARRLTTDKSLRDSLVAAAENYAKANASPSPTPAKSEAEAASSAAKLNTGSSAPSTTLAAKPNTRALASPSVSVVAPSPSLSPSPVPSVSPLSVPSPSATESPSVTVSNSATKANAAPPLPPACVKDEGSAECKYEKSLVKIQSLGLPLGWDSSDDIRQQWPGWHWKHPGGWWDQLYWHWLGWLLTALAISLGAPFWFDMLNKLIVVRSTVKPREKSADEPSKG
jgi:hypothetical protein